MELTYPFVICIGILVITLLIICKFNKKDKYKNGKKVANTKYVKDDPYYKKKMRQYKIYSIAIKVICLFSILLSFILLSRPTSIETVDNSKYSRDIILCMDVSTSVNELNKELVKNLKETVKELKGERFGISIFNTSSVLLVPLTDDYEYVLNALDTIEQSIEASESSKYDNDTIVLLNYIRSGTLIGNEEKGSSIIGDGLASCVYNFSNLEENRSRTIIFSTDNALQGTATVSLQEAAKISKNNNITVFGIGTKNMSEEDKKDMKTAIELTGGTFYTENSSGTVNDIVKNIEKKGKSLIKDQKITRKIEIPKIPFIILIISILGMCILNKKMKV